MDFRAELNRFGSRFSLARDGEFATAIEYGSNPITHNLMVFDN